MIFDKNNFKAQKKNHKMNWGKKQKKKKIEASKSSFMHLLTTYKI